jgi:hypothetical protein
VPIAKSATALKTTGLAFVIGAPGINRQPTTTKPRPNSVKRCSPNLVTNGPINPPCTTVATTPTIKNAVVAGPGPQPNTCLKNNTSTAVKPLKARKNKKKPRHRLPTFGLANTFASWAKGFKARFRGRARRCSAGWVSGSNSNTNTRLIAAIATAIHTGKVTLQRLNTPARAGPRMKPRPKATPIKPNALARFSGLLISASTAPALAAVPPLKPSSRRPLNSKTKGQALAWGQGISRVIANKAKPNTVPATQQAITGLLPKRSLRAPINGVAKNWARA